MGQKIADRDLCVVVLRVDLKFGPGEMTGNRIAPLHLTFIDKHAGDVLLDPLLFELFHEALDAFLV